jgi:CHAT domain-containing protein
MAGNQPQNLLLPDVKRLRSCGQYSAALELLDGEAKSCLDSTRLCLEKSLCYVFQHNFGSLLHTILAWIRAQGGTGSKERALILLLYDFGRFHMDLALTEAVATSNLVVAQWLTEKAIGDFDEIDVYIACMDHIIQDRGRRFLSAEDDEITEGFPSCERMEGLLRVLLQNGRFLELGLLHLSESATRSAHIRIRHLEESLKRIQESSSMPESQKHQLQSYLRLFLRQAYFEVSDSASSRSHLTQHWGGSDPNEMGENLLWSRYLVLRHKSKWEDGDIEDSKRLLLDFRSLHNMKGWQSSSFLLAEIFRGQGSRGLYSDLILSQFEARCVNKMHVLISSDKNSHRNIHFPGRLEHQPGEENVPQNTSNCASGFDFWGHYLRIFASDMRDRQLLSLVLRVCKNFFDYHAKCSIPQMKSLFASVVADCAESLGDIQVTMRWTQRAKEFAVESQDESLMAQAEYNAQIILADESVKIMDDPHGIKQREWEQARKVDLEILYEKAKQKGLTIYQYLYAYDLLCKELDEEIRSQTAPVGKRWLALTIEALKTLPENERALREPYMHFSLAHAKFEFGDLEGSVQLLDQIIEHAFTSGSSTIAPRALFTRGRAYIQIYLDSHLPDSWEKALDAIQKCQALSEKNQQSDEIACCHVLRAVLWQARSKEDSQASTKALHHISRAEELWSRERGELLLPRTLDGLLAEYALRHRNEANPYSVLGIAIEICFDSGDFAGAWRWTELAKARAFADQLKEVDNTRAEPLIEGSLESDPILIARNRSRFTYVHWITVTNAIYMLTSTNSKPTRMFRLDITVEAVEQWCKDLFETKEDLSDVESAEDLLGELAALCQPLSDSDICQPDELLVLCPSKLLFNIPLHALPVGDEPLISRCPVVYCYSSNILAQAISHRASRKTDSVKGSLSFFGNPTNDSPAGAESATILADYYHGQCFIESTATKDRFLQIIPSSDVINFHGHVITDEHPLNHAMIFHSLTPLKAREVFALDLSKHHPLVVLIGCGSGRERIGTGDEPLGFISAFLFAGASAVLATMWPIHDRLSGAAFSKSFYGVQEKTKGSAGNGDGEESESRAGNTVDLARRLRKAALEIRAKKATAAPYFWAGFVLYGDWLFSL